MIHRPPDGAVFATHISPPVSTTVPMNDHPEPTSAPESGESTSAPTPETPSSAPAPKPVVAPAPTPIPDPSAPVEITGDMQAEMDEAMNAATTPAASGGSPRKAIHGPRVIEGGREHRHGQVVSVGPEDVFIEFGPKELGVIPRAQFNDNPPEVGSEIEVVVDRYEANESLYLCRLPGAVQKADWELLEKGQVVEARVTGTNKGGLELEIANHRAFMPASQVDLHRIEDLSIFVGEKLKCIVTRVDRGGRGNITLSRRDILKEERARIVEELKSSLKEGDSCDGVVRKIMPFGAFVDIGGLDGLVHIGDISYERVQKVESVLKEGQQVKIKVLKLDWEQNRHSFGIKQLEQDPREAAMAEITEGEEISGTVTKLMDFGAFVEVAPGIEGLVHISELDWKRVQKTSDVVQPNQVVKVKVLKIDNDKRKISLSIKQTTDPPRAPQGGNRGRRNEPQGRAVEEIMKETPALRRAREAAKAKEKKNKGGGGLGNSDSLGLSLGDLKL